MAQDLPPKNVTPFVTDRRMSGLYTSTMLGTQELLALIRPLASNVEIARILNLPPPRISELFRGIRKLQLEEAKCLVEHFKLEEAQANQPSLPIAKLAVLHVAHGLGVADPPIRDVEELARDLIAFSACAFDPQWKDQIDALAQILQGIEVRRNAEKAVG